VLAKPNSFVEQKRMKKAILAVVTVVTFTATAALAMTPDVDLEACINGAVSATGSFSSQAAADRAAALDLEPCINGDVSPSGLPRAEANDAADTKGSPVLVE
jgi:hypothetical protein